VSNYQAVAWPQKVLARAARDTGLVTVPPEADGIMRRMPTVATVGSMLLSSFGVEIARVAGRAERIRLRSEPTGGSTLEIGDRIIPTDLAGSACSDGLTRRRGEA
jgi:adenylate cyclase